MAQAATRLPRRIDPLACLLVLICGLAFFWRLGSNGLFDLDEALYANAAREMVLRGDYVTPRVNGAFFFEKPPLIYWAAAAMFHVLGVNELAARLPSAIASAAIVVLIFWFGNRYLNRTAAFLSAATYALSPLVVGTARQMTTDAVLTLCVASALFSFFRAYTAADQKEKHWYYGFWAACGVGILDKGIAGVLPIFVIVVFILFDVGFDRTRAFRAFVETRPLWGAAIVLLIAAPWHIMAWRANGDSFVQEYVMRQHVERFRGGDGAHRLPFWFYAPAFLGGFFPWSLFVPSAMLDRQSTQTKDSIPPTRRFLIVWALTIFALFSIAGSKLVSYILPMYAPAALLVGTWLARAAEDLEKRRMMIVATSVSVLFTVIPVIVIMFQGPVIRLVERIAHQPARFNSIPEEFVPLALHLTAATALGTCVALIFLTMKRIRWATYSLIAGMTLFTGIAIGETIPAVDLFFSAPLRQAAREAGRLAGPNGHIAIVIGPPRRPSAIFYLPERSIFPGSGDSSNVFEMTWNDPLGPSLDAHTPGFIVTESRRIPEIEVTLWVKPVRSFEKWMILRVEGDKFEGTKFLQPPSEH